MPTAARAPAPRRSGLTVAVTGPTGEIGRALVAALERSSGVARVLGMARRPFDPSAHGWKKVSYRQGDVLNPDDLAELMPDADVVVHLAFLIMGGARETRAPPMIRKARWTTTSASGISSARSSGLRTSPCR